MLLIIFVLWAILKVIQYLSEHSLISRDIVLCRSQSLNSFILFKDEIMFTRLFDKKI